jgi:hypothetical protein
MITIDGSNEPTTGTYSGLKTAAKAAPAFIMILVVQAAKAAAAAAGITIDDATLTSIALAGYGGLMALINWIKNRKKGK